MTKSKKVLLGFCFLVGFCFLSAKVSAVSVTHSRVEFSAQESHVQASAQLNLPALIRLDGNYGEEIQRANFEDQNVCARLALPKSRHLLEAIESVQRLLTVIYGRIDAFVLAYQSAATVEEKAVILQGVTTEVQKANAFGLWVLSAMNLHVALIHSDEAVGE